MPKGVAAIVFFFAWLLCGCGVETMLDHPASGVITLVALIVVIACANVLTRKIGPTGSGNSHRGQEQ